MQVMGSIPISPIKEKVKRQRSLTFGANLQDDIGEAGVQGKETKRQRSFSKDAERTENDDASNILASTSMEIEGLFPPISRSKTQDDLSSPRTKPFDVLEGRMVEKWDNDGPLASPSVVKPFVRTGPSAGLALAVMLESPSPSRSPQSYSQKQDLPFTEETMSPSSPPPEHPLPGLPFSPEEDIIPGSNVVIAARRRSTYDQWVHMFLLSGLHLRLLRLSY
jgi:hypothetical protein